MLPSPIEYYKASSVADAVDKLKANPDSKILAGGHSLIPILKLRLNNPPLLIDLGGIGSLSSISENNGNIEIGAMVTHGQLANSALIKSKLPIYAEIAATIGDIQIRNMGTIGGSIAHADPSADWPVALLLTDSMVVTNERQIPATDFFTGFFSTALNEGEIVTGISVPIPAQNTKMNYQKYAQPASRFAIVGCGVSVNNSGGNISSAKVAFTGVSNGPYRDHAIESALNGQSVTNALAGTASQSAGEGIYIREDNYASPEYRSQMAKVFAKKAIEAVCN
jgi:aerobic carbon-monoxide dehydrogenase medium subunit